MAFTTKQAYDEIDTTYILLSNKLTQAKGFRQSIDIKSHLLCFDHTAGQRECSPF